MNCESGDRCGSCGASVPSCRAIPLEGIWRSGCHCRPLADLHPMQCLVAALLMWAPALADDVEIAKALRNKGAKAHEANGFVTVLEIGNCSKWSDEDFRRVAGLAKLRSLTVGPGLNDQSLALLGGLSSLEYLQTNESLVTDEGVRFLAGLKKLRTVKLFHPCKAFLGSGLASLADLPALESLTVAGSLAFGDDGMAAVSTLVRLRELRTWHAGQTLDGIKKLRELKNLRSLTLGQRLSYKPPTALSDETLSVLAELRSLETLRLEEARLTADSLIQLKSLPELKTLVLEGIDIPEGEVERLRQEIPKAKIQWTKPNETYMKRIRALFGN